MKKFVSTILALTLATLGVACTPINQAINATPSTQTTNISAANISTAQQVGQLNYIENLKSPEDLVQIRQLRHLPHTLLNAVPCVKTMF